MRRTFWVGVGLVLLASLTASSQVLVRINPSIVTKYVDNSGAPACADSPGNGAELTPYCTVTYGISHISGGQILYVKNGTYAGDFTITGPSGTSTTHTIISAYPGHAPVLDHGTFANGRIKISHSCSWIDFVGFTITNHNQGLYLDDDAGTDVACNHITVDRVTIHDVGQEGLAIRGGTPTGPRDFIVKNSTIYNTGRNGTGTNGEGLYVGNSTGTDNTNTVSILNNTIHDAQDECIELKGDSHDVIVDGNTLYNCLLPGSSFSNGGGAIEVDELRNASADSNQIIRNNIVHDIRFDSGITKRGIRCGTHCKAYNNVLYTIDSANNCILVNGDAGHTRLIYHNTADCTTGNAVVNSAGGIDSQNNLGPATAGNNRAITSSDFVNYAGHDYRILSGQPPLNAGANLTATVPTDILAIVRSITPTLGAYEGAH